MSIVCLRGVNARGCLRGVFLWGSSCFSLIQASLPAPEDPRVRRTEPPTPLPNRLVGHGDAPLSDEIFGIAEAQTEPVVEPDGLTDDVRWESVSVELAAGLVIGLLCQPPPQLDNTLFLAQRYSRVLERVIRSARGSVTSGARPLGKSCSQGCRGAGRGRLPDTPLRSAHNLVPDDV